jgi:hypothetical protein
MYIIRAIVTAIACCTIGNSLMAEHFSYGDAKTASVRDERFRGQYCRVSVYGPTGGSHVKGNYDEPNGVLKIDVDRMSYLEVSGRAKKVVIAFVDRGSNVDLSNLSIGTGGVEIHSVRRSKVDIGQCVGPATIKNAESSSITLHPGSTVIGRDRLTDGSKVFFEE